MVSKSLSPEYFKKVCETIWRHDWKSDFAFRSFFRKMMIIFDPNDVEEFQELIEDFEYDFFFTPMDIEPIFNSMKAKGTSMRIRIDGEKHYIHADQVQKELENLIRWCFKKLNSYYVKYGVNIEGIDVSEIPDYGGSMP